MVDITEHLNNLNELLQGRKKVVTQYYDSIRAFKLKLSLWETQLSSGDTAHFPCLRDVRATGFNADMDYRKSSNKDRDSIRGRASDSSWGRGRYGQIKAGPQIQAGGKKKKNM